MRHICKEFIMNLVDALVIVLRGLIGSKGKARYEYLGMDALTA
jgi:hypothetical protein